MLLPNSHCNKSSSSDISCGYTSTAYHQGNLNTPTMPTIADLIGLPPALYGYDEQDRSSRHGGRSTRATAALRDRYADSDRHGSGDGYGGRGLFDKFKDERHFDDDELRPRMRTRDPYNGLPYQRRSREEYVQEACPGERHGEDSHRGHRDNRSASGHYVAELREPITGSGRRENSHRGHRGATSAGGYHSMEEYEPMSRSQPPGTSPSSRNSPFGRIQELRLPSLQRKSEARALLQEATSLCAPIAQRRGWCVPVVKEFLPRDKRLQGLHPLVDGRSVEVELRVRRQYDPQKLVENTALIDTLLHELVHLEVPDHGSGFDRLWDALRIEFESLYPRYNLPRTSSA